MEFPEIGELVPHSGAMLLLRRVVEHDEDRTVCELDPADSGPFLSPEGEVPAWVALEYMAQCAAAHAGLLARAAGGVAGTGMLLGTRRLRLAVDGFPAGETLRVTVTCAHAGSQMVSFAGKVLGSGGDVLAEARFNVYTGKIPGREIR
jgi:predicted hotdog family 3-hydroxylacyl-ACP dehydratase